MNKDIENGVKIYSYDAAEVYGNEMFYKANSENEKLEPVGYGINKKTDVEIKEKA